MRSARVFIIRLILSAIFATIACRIFFNPVQTNRVILLTAILFVLSYVFEAVRKRDGGGDHGGK
jgi:hypothetical protein